MDNYRTLWFTLIAVLTVTFTLLGYYGTEVYRSAPPLPDRILTAEGRTIYTKADILDGQTAWQSVGGMQLGSIWGHGAYQAPDWTADWLHRELSNWLELAAQADYGTHFDALDGERQALLTTRLKGNIGTTPSMQQPVP